MKLFITRSPVERHQADNDTGSRFLLLEDGQADFYRKYKTEGFIPKAGSNNRMNLFDDSDTKDNYWFNVTRKFLRNY